MLVSSDVTSDGIEVGVSDLLKLCRVKDLVSSDVSSDDAEVGVSDPLR